MTKFQLLDADYVQNNGKPVMRFFGRTESKKSITVFIDGFLPYFFVIPAENRADQIKSLLEKEYKHLLVSLKTEKKHLPIGFQKTPAEVLKITINNPAMVPTIRDDLKKRRLAKEIFEADILFKYRYMTDNGIFGMRWYEVEGSQTRTTSVKTDLKFQARGLKEVNIEDNADLKYMSIDIETFINETGIPDHEKDPIIMMSIFFYPSYKGKNTMVLTAKKTKKLDGDVIGFNDEKEMLDFFVKTVDSFDPDIILGYNINNFDLPYIEGRLKANKISRSLGRCSQKMMRLNKFAARTRVTLPGRVVADVYDLIKEATKFGMYKGLKRYGLGDVSEMILGEKKVDVSHSEINTHWSDDGDDFRKLVDYSRKDAELPMKILFEKNMLDKFIEICKVSGIVLQDALGGGESTRIDNLLLREFNKRGFVVPNKPDNAEYSKRDLERRKSGLKGGFVLKPQIGFHDTCVAYLDFKSMYPSIMISFNICPTTLVTGECDVETVSTPTGSKFVSTSVMKGIFPEIVGYLISTRDKIKTEMKKTKSKGKKRYLYAKQNAFKIIANAFYGYSGYMRARLYVMEIASAVTGTGRHLIHKTKDIVEANTPYRVIYSDTDSTMIKLKTKDVEEAYKIGEELSEMINKGLGDVLKMKVEGIFKSLLILSKKRYAGWSFEPTDEGWDDFIVTKGIETVRRDWCDLVSDTLNEVLNTILKEQDVKKALNIVKKEIDDIRTGKMNIDRLVITKSISKAVKSYKGVQPHVELVKKMRKRDAGSAPGVGDRIGYVIVRGIGLISKRTEDPEYVREHNIPVDFKYYVESQLLPPLERVFSALKINRSEFMGIGRQIDIFDAVKSNGKEEMLPSLREIEGLVCLGCNNMLNLPTFSGRCNNCSGELVFYHGGKRSRVYDPWS